MHLFPRAALASALLFLLCQRGRASVKGEAAPNHHSLDASEIARSGPSRELEGTICAHGCEWHAVGLLTQERLGVDNWIALPYAGPGILVPIALIMG